MTRARLLIIGGGIVGLATALAAQRRRRGDPVLVLEKEDHVAAHQSGHNSGVIHSGIYYRPGTLRAELCVSGAATMVEFCRQQGLPHEVCGKVIVATAPAELPRLEELRQRAEANGVRGVRLIGRDELRALEPHAAGLAALHVPSTGIADFAAVTRRYAELVVEAGGRVQTGARVRAIRSEPGGFVLETTAGEFAADFLINCAGLHSDRVARLAGADPGVQIVPFRGEYYELKAERRSLVRGLIYPVPDPRFPFLGVHFTRRVTGEVEAGPNAVLALKREGYRKTSFSPRDALDALSFPGFWRMAGRWWRVGFEEYHRSFSKRLFVRELQKLVPEIRRADLAGGGSGVRAQALGRDGSLVDDFQFVGHGRALHVLNVPSPAATASLKIGEKIVEQAAAAWGLADMQA